MENYVIGASTSDYIKDHELTRSTKAIGYVLPL